MSDDYEVGYKRPPKRTRWKKGESGNRNRRRSRRPLRLIEVIDKLLLTPVTVTENGLASQMCQSACNFDPRSASNFDPLEARRAVVLAPSELVGVAETARARVVG